MCSRLLFAGSTLAFRVPALPPARPAEPGGFKVKAAAANRGGGGGRRRKALSPAGDQSPAPGEQAGEEAAAEGADEAGGESAAADDGEQQGSPAGSGAQPKEGGTAGEGSGDDDELADAELARRHADVGRSGDPMEIFVSPCLAGLHPSMHAFTAPRQHLRIAAAVPALPASLLLPSLPGPTLLSHLCQPPATPPLLQQEEEYRQRPATREVSFEAARRIRQECAQPVVLHFYAWLLQGYRTNAPFTNHSIVSLFRRIADPTQLNLEPMLYQVGGCCCGGCSMCGGRMPLHCTCVLLLQS